MDYDFEAKQVGFRRQAWMFADRACHTPLMLRKVAILDTPQGLEVRHLVRIGYQPRNILVVNYRAAKLAAMTKALRADGIEGVRTKAGEFTAVLMKWGEPLHVISFDTTSNLTAESFRSIGEVMDLHSPEASIMVMLAGREDAALYGMIRETARDAYSVRDSCNRVASSTHLARAVLLSEHVGRHGDMWWSTYLSSCGQPMLWTVMKRPGGNKFRAGSALAIAALESRIGRPRAYKVKRADLDAEIARARAAVGRA